MSESITIEITRPGNSGNVPITVEVSGNYVERQPGGLETQEIPAYFEDIKAFVAATAYVDEDETTKGWLEGERIKLTPRELELASDALVRDMEEAIP